MFHIMTTKNTSAEKTEKLVSLQKTFFRSEKTLDLEFRKEMLLRLQKALSDWEERLSEALWIDLHKSY
jgi:aldehyde dehydrogenase (NAD+)